MVAQNVNGQLNQDLENYFLSIYNAEKLKFIECTQMEGLKESNLIS